MFGCVIAGVLVVAAMKIWMRHRYGHGWHHACHGYGHHRMGRLGYWGEPDDGRYERGGRGFFLSYILRDLHLTQEQEKLARDVIADLKRAAKETVSSARDLRQKVAAALRTESFDESQAGEVLGDI